MPTRRYHASHRVPNTAGFSATVGRAPQFSITRDERLAAKLAELDRLRRRDSYQRRMATAARRKESVYALTGVVDPRDVNRRTLRRAQTAAHKRRAPLAVFTNKEQ